MGSKAKKHTMPRAHPHHPCDSNILQGKYIFIQAFGRNKGDVFRDISLIRVSAFLATARLASRIQLIVQSHGGVTVADPWAPVITHAMVHVGRRPVMDYSHSLEQSQLTGQHPDSESKYQRTDWSFERILEVFITCNRHYPASGAKVVQAPWLMACLKAGHCLDVEDDWGGWLVR